MDIEKALRKAYSLGQRYWQQADSEYVSQNKKASATEAEFDALISTTMAELSAPVPAMPMQDDECDETEGFTDFFNRRMDYVADKHPTKIVRQLAQLLRSERQSKAMPIPKQEPAGAVQDYYRVLFDAVDFTKDDEGRARAIIAADEMLENLEKLGMPSPRITEQDAREIVCDYENWRLSCRYIGDGFDAWTQYLFYSGAALLNKLNANAVPEVRQEPIFYYRPTSSGGYEGPISAACIEKCRIDSGVWKPLYADPVPAKAAAIPDNVKDIISRLASELESEIEGRHTEGMMIYPSIKSKYDADMSTVIEAREFISESPKPDEVKSNEPMA